MNTFDHDKARAALAGDREFGYLARGWTAVIRLERGERADDVTLADGTIVEVAPATAVEPEVRLVCTEEGWEKLLAGDPEALMAMTAGGEMARLEADLITQLGPYARAIRRLIKVLRGMYGTLPPEEPLVAEPFADSDVAVGRYVRLDVDGSQYRVYYEEAGQGVPLLLQHTAGADSRQWRNFLADPVLQKKYRMIAFDLPYHGRSLPPVVGPRWWEESYEPGRELIMKWVVALKIALELDRPLIMGLSVGGQLAADLLAHHGEHFGGAVAMNGTFHNDSLAFLDNSPFGDHRIPREYYASLMYELTSPIAPEAYRRENQWIYSSNGPGVYRGDNLYYSQEHDLRVDGHLIDTATTPLFAVVGEFDPMNGVPGGPQEIPDNIPGARFAVLPGLSHFAMSDDPVRFNAAVTPILDELVESGVHAVSNKQKAV
ncbi:alpha/beta hydrolase [Nocardia abscessus]|uniref:alpha/beta fold hydrolase n=1 Tax=Nocardia abscessus TaxID=120957 RepID=UPI00189633A4|nr:alpha/beta hydrolase [Nocardia abscessus]MBF6472524.1 alpha/beta hydrolase [Nocardia abscessus]